MEASEQNPLFCWTTAHIDNRVEEVSTTLAALEGFADELVMVC